MISSGWIKVAALAFVVLVLAGAILRRPDRPPVGTKIEQEGRVVELLARTPAGDEVWKLSGDGLIVPSVFVISRTGAVAHR